ncbi:hypothetical protein BTK96_001049 [Burkholderia pyrrocinia]|nr:hypothetical protein [Burkholderia pyrrocinia]EKS9892800.1 hypothetical protein [Burkholderia pyrrocinia]EKS9907675.1 hypothetical protein [Burkholderia pyrrocinia]
MTNFVWHYTACEHLAKIVKSGELRPSNAGSPETAPLLWFSTNQRWEPTARKLVAEPGVQGLRPLSFHMQAKLFGCVRFGLSASDPQLMDWKAACTFDGTSREKRRAMELRGKRDGASPKDWFATSLQISLDKLSCQLWIPKREVWAAGLTPQQILEIWTEAQHEAA